MNFLESVLTEELRLGNFDETYEKLFRSYLKEVFSSSFLSKIDRQLNTELKIKHFSKRSNIMCYTQGTTIYVNTPMFKSLEKDKAMTYLMHELFHLLENTGHFPELKKLSNRLAIIISMGVPKGKEAEFLTGKEQNIHSSWKGEVLNYACNNSIKWDLAEKGTKMAYKTALHETGIFNLESPFWKKRLGDTKILTNY